MGYVQTVLGPVAGASLGFTLPHEHTYCELWLIPDRHDFAGQLADEELLIEELGAFKRQGGGCLVDVTLPGIGRNPRGLRSLSERSGLHIVMGTGWYRQPWYPAEDLIDRRGVNELAEQLVKEFDEGVRGTGIKPGIIGEIGVHKSWLSAQEERVHRASARAARQTGLAITTHSPRGEVGLAQLAIFEEEGVDPSRVIIGHVGDFPVLPYALQIAERGAHVQFDTLGYPDPITSHKEARIIRLILQLLERGLAKQILLSHDVCRMDHLRAFGGNGYAYIPSVFVPRLHAAGVPEALIRTMCVDNPRRLLEIVSS
jgi:predicted metal-dependent phosphotriesterase family hydrolase